MWKNTLAVKEKSGKSCGETLLLSLHPRRQNHGNEHVPPRKHLKIVKNIIVKLIQ